MLQGGGPGLTRYPGVWGWRQACATFLRGEIFSSGMELWMAQPGTRYLCTI